MSEYSNFTKFRDKILEDLEISEAYDKAGERLKLYAMINLDNLSRMGLE